MRKGPGLRLQACWGCSQLSLVAQCPSAAVACLGLQALCDLYCRSKDPQGPYA